MQDLQTDRTLAKSAMDGDEAAWREIFESSHDRLFSFLCYQVGDREEALDLLQETFIKAHRGLSGYRGDAPLSAWLRKIALRLSLDWKRAALKRIKKRVGLDGVTLTVDPKVDHVRFESEHESLRSALEKLSPKQRAALLLHDWEEQSFAEISDTLGCKESTVRVHHARAREKMKAFLSEDALCIDAEGLEGQKI